MTSNSLSDFSGNLDDDANTGIFKYQYRRGQLSLSMLLTL